MAVGVPEAEVFAAADRVLARGERPTVERVRVELGRGSPARVGQLLEVWWDALAKRLAGETRLPALPASAAAAFTQVWAAAVAEAEMLAAAALAEERQAVFVQTEALLQERAQWEEVLKEAQAQTDAARSERTSVERRLDDLQQLLQQHVEQKADHLARLELLSQQVNVLTNERRALIEAADAREAAAAQARDAAAQHIRSVEDRAHTRVGRDSCKNGPNPT